MMSGKILLVLMVCAFDSRVNMYISGAMALQDMGLPPDVDTIQLEKDIFSQYQSGVHPLLGEKPVEVSAKVTVLFLTNVDETNMVFSAQIDLQQEWTDSRLNHSFVNGTLRLEGSKITEKLWTPGTFVTNAKTRSAEEQMNYALIGYNGTVHFGQVLTLDISCDMDFSHYPMDKQTCPIKLSSYSSTIKLVRYQWMADEPVVLSSDISYAVDLKKATAEKPGNVKKTTGTFSLLVAKLHFERRIDFFAIQIYVPIILLSIVSWFVFWFPRNAIGERSIFLILVVVAMMLVFGFSYHNAPKVNYLTSCDMFILTSFCHVFIVLVVCLIIYYIYLNEMAKDRREREKDSNNYETTEEEADDPEVTVIAPRHPLQNADDYDLYLRAMKLQFANPGERGINVSPQAPVHPVNDGITHDLTQPRKRDTNQKKQKKRKPRIRDSRERRDERECDWRASQIVQCCARLIFPLFYVAFNIFYWITAYTD